MTLQEKIEALGAHIDAELKDILLEMAEKVAPAPAKPAKKATKQED